MINIDTTINNHPLTICCLLQLMLYMKNLLTPLTYNPPKKNGQNSIANVAIDDAAQSYETTIKHNHSVTSLGDQVFIGTTTTHR